LYIPKIRGKLLARHCESGLIQCFPREVHQSLATDLIQFGPQKKPVRRRYTGEKERKMENIEQRVKKIVAEQLGVNESEIKSESSFVDDLGADSLDTVELVMALEEEFETEIPDEDAEKITTVRQAVDYINSHGKGA